MEWGAFILGIAGIIAGLSYNAGYKHGRIDQFEKQADNYGKPIF